MPGGITSAVHLLDLETSGEVRQLVLKRWTRGDVAERRRCMDRDARTLQLVEAAEIPAPRYVTVGIAAAAGALRYLTFERYLA